MNLSLVPPGSIRSITSKSPVNNILELGFEYYKKLLGVKIHVYLVGLSWTCLHGTHMWQEGWANFETPFNHLNQQDIPHFPR